MRVRCITRVKEHGRQFLPGDAIGGLNAERVRQLETSGAAVKIEEPVRVTETEGLPSSELDTAEHDTEALSLQELIDLGHHMKQKKAIQEGQVSAEVLALVVACDQFTASVRQAAAERLAGLEG